jgi:polysaccharide export outer membrane protein
VSTRVGIALALGAALAQAAAASQEPARSPAQVTHPDDAPPRVLPDYEIGAQDILRITVYGHDDLKQTVVVQVDGTFTFPLIGTVEAAGKTPLELERHIATLLSQGYIRNPQVSVIVEEYRSKTVFVVGEVSRPGTYPFAGRSMSLVEVLAKAGPMTVNAGAEVLIVRPRPGSDVSRPVLPFEVAENETAPDPGKQPAEVFRINVRDIQAGHLEKNIELHPNDTVFVPQAPKVFVTGEVRNPGAYPWFPGMSARQLISVAGGLTPEGSDGRLKIVRERGGETHEDGIDKDDDVAPGETLVVRRRLF